MNWIAAHEDVTRVMCFVLALLVLSRWEQRAPLQSSSFSRASRRFNNLAVLAFNTAILRLLIPAAAVSMAAIAGERSWGLLNQLALPMWLALLAALVALDLVMWLQHWAMHEVPALWRVHRVHHADIDCDVTTALRFHPLEIVLSMVIKVAAVLAIGPTVFAVIMFEVLLNVGSMFNHANIRLPRRLERTLRIAFVTPSIHRIHHSVESDEQNSNFGFCLCWWDRILGRFRAEPRRGLEAMKIGIDGLDDPRHVICLWGMLWMPFARRKLAR